MDIVSYLLGKQSSGGGGSLDGVYKVNSREEMEAISNPQTNDLCIIYDETNNKVGLYQYENNEWTPIVKFPIADDFTEVTCINTTQGQFINTNVLTNENTNVEYKMSIGSFKQYGPHLLSGQSTIFPMIRTLSGSQFYCQIGSEVFYIGKIPRTTNKIYKFECKGTNIYLDDELKGTIARVEFTDTKPLYIGTYGGEPNTATYSSSLKIYYVKIFEGDTLIRNMIPCYRNDDKKVGMYDTINNVFYTNDGSGNFTYDD